MNWFINYFRKKLIRTMGSPGKGRMERLIVLPDREDKTYKEMKYVHVLIWDDFYNDGLEEEDKKFETYIYVRNTNISHNKCKKYLEVLLDYIKINLNIEGVVLYMKFYEAKKDYPNLVGTVYQCILTDQWEIKLEGITRKRLEEWMNVLEKVEIIVEDVHLKVVSVLRN